MTNIIAGLVIVLIVGLAAFYVYREKKSGKKCIGCPECNSCKKKGECANCNLFGGSEK